MNVNAPAPPFSGTMDVDEFMAFLEMRPHGEHWELIEGVAVMMAPPSYAQQRVVRNLCELLNSAFAARLLDLFAYFDAGVRSPGVRNFQPEPDVVVVPGVAGYDLLLGALSTGCRSAVALEHAHGNRAEAAALPRGAGQSLCRRDRPARIPGGDSRQAEQLAADDAHGAIRPD